MTASADITVIPTGGMTPVDLADLAAAILALPAPEILCAFCTYSAGSPPSLQISVIKQTGRIENLTATIDSTGYSFRGTDGTNLADGTTPGFHIDSPPSSSGSHTVVLTMSVSGANVTTNYTV
jgi:hypothetical protein